MPNLWSSHLSSFINDTEVEKLKKSSSETSTDRHPPNDSNNENVFCTILVLSPSFIATVFRIWFHSKLSTHSWFHFPISHNSIVNICSAWQNTHRRCTHLRSVMSTNHSIYLFVHFVNRQMQIKKNSMYCTLCYWECEKRQRAWASNSPRKNTLCMRYLFAAARHR